MVDRYFGKRRTIAQLERIVSELRASAKRVVLANGCFDIIHVGHIRYLRAAKSLGDVLIVAINDDDSVASIKGSGRPFLDQDARAEIVAGLECTDWVCLFSGKDVSEVLLRLRPDVHAKGTDYTVETVPERAMVRSFGGQIVICGDEKRHSSTDIIQRIRAAARKCG